MSALDRLSRTARLGRSVPARVKARVASHPAILMYHRISDSPIDPWGVAVSPARFDEHMAALVQGPWHPVSMSRLNRALATGTQSRHQVVVTFDDGYADNFHAALPILERYEIPATVYVVTGALGTAGEFWWDELERIWLTGLPLPEQAHLILPDGELRIELEPSVARGEDPGSVVPGWRAGHGEPPGPRQAQYEQIWARLVGMSPAAQTTAMDTIRTWAALTDADRADHRRLTLEELAEFGRHPLIEIGAHTVSHPSLPALATEERYRELVGAREALEELVDQPVDQLAYPYGHHDETTVALARKAGFSSAVTTVGRRLRPPEHPLQLPRLTINNTDGDQFTRRLQWAP